MRYAIPHSPKHIRLPVANVQHAQNAPSTTNTLALRHIALSVIYRPSVQESASLAKTRPGGWIGNLLGLHVSGLGNETCARNMRETLPKSAALPALLPEYCTRNWSVVRRVPHHPASSRAFSHEHHASCIGTKLLHMGQTKMRVVFTVHLSCRS